MDNFTTIILKQKQDLSGKKEVSKKLSCILFSDCT